MNKNIVRENKFFGEIFEEREANVICFGVAIGKNGKKALKAIRNASLFVEPFDEGKNLLENIKIFDEGNLKLEYLDQIFEKISEIRNKNKIPLMLSRCHLPTLYALGAFDPKTHLIVFDAHLDLKDSYIDERIEEMNYFPRENLPSKEFNDSTWLRRFIDYSYNSNILVLGVRDFDEEEMDFARKNNIKFFTSNQIKRNLEKVKKLIKDFSKGKKVYISLDIDVFDPSIAPAVDYPIPNGLNFSQFCELVDSIKGKMVGIDVNCFKKLKNSEVTEFLIVKSVFKLLSKIKKERKG